jgi:lysophospholipid acyltransferase (LPLAT)-like uncharacterized protein
MGGCWTWGAAYVMAWLLVASTLLWLTWNKVIKAQFNVKIAKFWHAMLLLTTIGFLVVPRFCMMRWAHHGGCDKHCETQDKHDKHDKEDM